MTLTKWAMISGVVILILATQLPKYFENKAARMEIRRSDRSGQIDSVSTETASTP